MHKSKKKVLVEKIKKKDDAAPQLIETYLFSNACIKLVITYFILILSFILVEDINKLSFISPKIFFTSMIIFISIMIFFLSFLVYFKFGRKESLKERFIVKIFDIYDFLSFILMTINVCFFIILFILTPTVIDGNSMKNSYYDGDRVLVWHLGYTPKIDDAVIIDVASGNYPQISNFHNEKFFIKRVIATSGDKVENTGFTYSKTAYLKINGKILNDTWYTQEEFQTMTTYEKTNASILDENSCIKKGYSIVIGDNRSNSYDSRYIGAVLDSDIQGKVVFIFFSKNGNFGFPKENIKIN